MTKATGPCGLIWRLYCNCGLNSGDWLRRIRVIPLWIYMVDSIFSGLNSLSRMGLTQHYSAKQRLYGLNTAPNTLGRVIHSFYSEDN